MAVLGRKLPSLLGKIFTRNAKDVVHTTNKRAPPKGCFFMYVGKDRKKYSVPITLFSSLNFKGLLEEYEEEIQAAGPLTLPSCSTSEFEAVLKAEKSCRVREEEFEKMSLLYDQD